MKPDTKITTGPNDRPRNETIGQTGQGLPDDSSTPVTVDEATVSRVREQLTATGQQAAGGTARNTDTVPPGTPGSGDNICRLCNGSGSLNGGQCPDCGGSGIVATAIGGA